MITLDIPSGEFAAYIFDCDGTLADTMPLHYQAWMAILEPLGSDFPEEYFYALGGVPTAKVMDYLNARNGSAHDSLEIARRKEIAFMELIPQVRAIEPVLEFVKTVAGRAPLAVASGGFKNVVLTILNALHVRHYFQAVVTMEDVVHGKPAPDTFLEAARQLGVEPARCLVFEDTPLGREAALAAGMQCVLVPSGMVVEREKV